MEINEPPFAVKQFLGLAFLAVLTAGLIANNTKLRITPLRQYFEVHQISAFNEILLSDFIR